MVNTYVLVNPHIEGDFKSKIKAKNSVEASNMFYKSLSGHFNNSVPKFHFTIQKGSSGDGKFYHWEVKENRRDNEVKYNIKPYTIDEDPATLEQFQTKLANFKSKFNQEGGKHRRKSNKHHSKSSDSSESSDSSDFDDSSDDIYRRAKSYLPSNQPIYYWWYDPYVYKLDSLYIPTFYSYVTPYIELSLRL
jgi:hypothetical protein